MLTPQDKESLRLQQKVWKVIEFIWDNAAKFLFGWIISIGIVSMAVQDQHLFNMLALVPVYCLVGLAVVFAAWLFVWRVIRIFL